MDKLAIAMLGRLPKEQVKEIIESFSIYKREELAESPELDLCGEVCYKVLAEDEYSWVRIYLTKNPAIGKYPEVMSKLSNDEDEWVRKYLVVNPEIGKCPEVIKKLAEDRSEDVRRYLAFNPEIGKYPEIMKKLARDKNRWVKKAICTRDRLEEECPECVQICEEYGYR